MNTKCHKRRGLCSPKANPYLLPGKQNKVRHKGLN